MKEERKAHKGTHTPVLRYEETEGITLITLTHPHHPHQPLITLKVRAEAG
jgi:hypothetical protein